MVAKQEDDEELSEVKVILQSLQQMGIDRPPAASANKPGSNVARLESLTNRKHLPQTRGPAAEAARRSKETSGKRPAQKRLGALALATIATGTVVLLATDMFFKYWPANPTGNPAIAGGTNSSPPPSALPAWITRPATGKGAAGTATFAPPGPPSPAIANAKQMMDSGKIKAARELLRQPSLASSQDGAWLIARSYDPNYLATVKSPDAAGDKEKAAEWYSRWRAIGAGNGAPMDDVHFRRLIESLD